jgi:hypothetical protein
MSRISRVLLSAFFVAAFLSQSGNAQSAPEDSGPTQSKAAAQEQAIYAQGTKAMDEQRWSDAVTAFDRVASAKGRRSDAGLYWKAYSLNKLGRNDESRATCDSLGKQQPSSPWNRECLALQARSAVKVAVLSQLAEQQMASAEQQMASAKQKMDDFNVGMAAMNHQLTPLHAHVAGDLYSHANHPADQDDIKILALNSLMRQDPGKAMPLLQSLLKSDKPVAMRKQALFVLSRSKDPQARALLADTAKNKANPEMQCAALELLSLSQGKDLSQTLVEAYRESTNDDVKHAAINGLFLTHDAPGLVDLARGEKDLNLKLDIVSQLSLIKDKAATDYMLELLK